MLQCNLAIPPPNFPLVHLNLRLMTRVRLLAIACAFLVCSLHQTHAQSRTVVIDAGHGGYDRGGVPYQKIGEKSLTLDVAQRLRRVLQSQGYRTVMTRDSDVFISLGQRVAIANSYSNAIFVSIHFNSAPRWSANGIETYYYRSDASSLAASIHRNVVAMTSSENRGIRRRGYYVLRRTAIPAVLVECGFLTNPSEGRNALNAGYRQRLAETIARGINREPAPFTRPLARGSAASSEVLPQPFNGPDYVKAAPRAKKSSKSSHRRRHSTTRKKSSSETRKSSDD